MTRNLLFSAAVAVLAAPFSLSASDVIPASRTYETSIGAVGMKPGKDFRPKKKKKGKRNKHRCEAFQR